MIRDRPALIAAGLGLAGALAIGWWLRKKAAARDSGDNESLGRRLGRGVVEWTMEAGGNVIDAFDGAGKAIEQAIWPDAECAAALRANDWTGAATACAPGTFFDWLTHGRPTDCREIAGKIQCLPAKPRAGASGNW